MKYLKILLYLLPLFAILAFLAPSVFKTNAFDTARKEQDKTVEVFLNTVQEGDKRVIVLYKSSCPTCKGMAEPILDTLATTPTSFVEVTPGVPKSLKTAFPYTTFNDEHVPYVMGTRYEDGEFFLDFAQTVNSDLTLTELDTYVKSLQ